MKSPSSADFDLSWPLPLRTQKSSSPAKQYSARYTQRQIVLNIKLHMNQQHERAIAVQPPLVVDLDGTLTPTDTLIESLAKLVKQNPLDLIRLPLWILQGRARLKEALAERVTLEPKSLPYNAELLDYLQTEKRNGRPIFLATAAHHSIAEPVAKHLGLFNCVLATQGRQNLKGERKLQLIREKVGESFVYAGDSEADRPIWKSSTAAILVGVSKRTATSVRVHTPIEREFPKEGPGFRIWLRAIRIHQWAKNLLLFVPLLTAFSFLNLEKLETSALAFLAFSLAASSTYLINDLWDLESDRAHPRKHRRPFASGQLPIMQGVVFSGISLSLGMMIAYSVSTNFLLALITYVALTSVYSSILKSYVLLDVMMLSSLYTLRIIAGSIAISVPVSAWLQAFSFFIFLSLALVKRCAELVSLQQIGRNETRGRDYRVSDLTVLWPLGLSSAVASIVVFGLFINAPETQVRYQMPELLWLSAAGLTYWISRLWIKTARGEMHDDPLIYAVQDFGSRVTILTIVAGLVLAHFLT